MPGVPPSRHASRLPTWGEIRPTADWTAIVLGDGADVEHVPPPVQRAIGHELRAYRSVFMTSPDLLVPTSVVTYGRRHFEDFFRGPDTSFEECAGRRWTSPARTRLHYLHGALHLTTVPGRGTYRRDGAAAAPLLLTQTDASLRRLEIVDNPYLSHCWDALRHHRGGIVVFGASLGPGHQLLVDALKADRDRPIAVAIHGHDEDDAWTSIHHAWQRLGVVRSFDAGTHPLGNPNLGAESAAA